VQTDARCDHICPPDVGRGTAAAFVLAGAVCALAFLVVFSVAVVFAYREMASDGNVSFIERQGTLKGGFVVSLEAVKLLWTLESTGAS
jgi:hypothetical protein